MPGGRPKNCWRPARERKLVRLYVLSNLNLEEIQKTLRKSDFDPSTSDMQKKLRSLLPKDYAKDYRTYRPSSHENARLRLLHAKSCSSGRIAKCQRSRSRARVLHRTESLDPEASGSHASAFRNYSRATSPSPRNYISMEWLNSPKVQLDVESDREFHAVEYTQRVNELRREAVFGTTSYREEIKNSPAIQPATFIQSEGGHTTSHNGDSQMGEAEYQIVPRHGPYPKAETSSTGDHEVSTLSDSLSIRSLGRRLARRYSQSTIEHIASILRSSLTTSRRSSLLSLISLVSSKVSSKVSTDQASPTHENKAAQTVPKGSKFILRRGKLALTHGEQRIWEDLIDESQLAQSSRDIPSYPEISLRKRFCCGMTAFPSCQRCGLSEGHQWAITTVNNPSPSVPFPTGLSSEFAHERDYFGNTPLHFVAANATGSTTTGWRTIKWLIYKGANVRARNTSGETFMHVLHRDQFKHTDMYAEVLLMLAELKFPFSQRDYHGQTLAEIFFTTVNPRDIPAKDFQIIFSHLLFDANAKCVVEFWRQTQSKSSSVQGEPSDNARHLAAMVAQGYRPLPSFQNKNFWSKRIETSDIVKEVDVNGDSALIHVVKAWREKHDERHLANVIASLISAGAEVPTRDRWGNTALAVAARRGLRPAVKTLLRSGANPNTRNYRGRGVLEQARESMRLAKKEGNAAKYAMVLSCVVLLVDYGAKEEPSAYDEFTSPAALAKVERAPGFV